MKYVVILLALLPLIRGETRSQDVIEIQPRSISSEILDFIESLKLQMPCGFEKYGIPPLAPYKTDHQDITIENKFINGFGEINNFRLDGLNNFDIEELKVNAILSRANFKLKWNHVEFTTQYNVTSAFKGMDLNRHGPANFALKNFTMWGVLKYSLGILGGKVSVKQLKVYVSLDEVHSNIEGLSNINIINKKLNRIIEEFFMIAVNDNSENVAELTNNTVVPLLNYMLGDMNLSDILAIIGGGNESKEKEPCVPPVDAQ